MQQHPLLISSLIEHAARAHPDVPIISQMPDAAPHRCTYTDIDRRARQLAGALTALGVREGDRVGTLAWNGHRHLERRVGYGPVHYIRSRDLPGDGRCATVH